MFKSFWNQRPLFSSPMLTRTLLSIALIFVFYITPGYPATAQLEPCFAKKLPQLKKLPAGTTIIQVFGHEFRNSDKCVPFFVTFTWENYYDRGDGYTHYSLRFVHTFPGELWYRTDKEEFTLGANPSIYHWKGLNKIRKFDGYGQLCKRLDEDGACEELHKFDRGQAHLLKTEGGYRGSLAYGYPGVTAQGKEVPIVFHVISPEFEFRNAHHEWLHGYGLLKINNAALASFDYRALVKEASRQGSYTTMVTYNQDNDVQDVSSGHKGKLFIKLDFDQRCDGNNRTDMDPCEQVAELLADLKGALEVRDLYKDVLPDAKDEFHLDKLVLDNLRLSNPDMDSKDEAWLLNNAGGTDPRTLEISVPDYCDECAARPLCKWQGDIMRVHENTHKEYLQDNPNDRKMLYDEAYQASIYPGVDQRGLAKAKIIADMESAAYNERAKYIKDLINKQLSQSPSCTFDPQFYSDFDALVNKIKY